jgi:tripartite-type tricarboxylate transporter receptor subunit TctC
MSERVKRHFMRAMAGLVLVLAFAAVTKAYAQEYPSKPLRMIVSFPPGGSTDIVARLMAHKLTEALGQQVIVDNRPGGAGGIIGHNLAAKAPADGYTLLMTTSITFTASAALYKNLPYDVLTDFEAVTLVASVPLALVVHPSLPTRSVKELIALAKAKPAQLNYASFGIGTSGHLAMEMFKLMAGVDITHIPYKGGGPALTGLISGEVQALIIATVGALPHVKSGRIRLLALTSATRSPELPDIPTVAETLPGYEVVLWYGLFTPAGTPKSVIGRLNKDAVKILQSHEMQKRFAVQGGWTVGNSPEEFQKIVRSDVATWTNVVKEAGIKVE